MFAPRPKYPANAKVDEVVLGRIELLVKVNQNGSNWLLVVDGGDPNNTFREHDIHIIRQRSLYIAVALRKFIAEVCDGARWTWKQCLIYSIKALSRIGLKTYKDWKTLQHWHRRLALNRKDGFGKAPPIKNLTPRFFLENPDAQEAFKQYGVQQLKELSVEKMHDYVLNKLVPILITKNEVDVEALLEDGTETAPVPVTEEQKKEYLKQYGVPKLHMSTVSRWMHSLGF
jgi:hypothetical protein